MFATGEIVGLAEWIIDDTCLVVSSSGKKGKNGSIVVTHLEGA